MLWQHFNGANLAYASQEYEKFLRDPQTVAEDWREQFALYGAPDNNFTKIVAHSDAQLFSAHLDAGMLPKAVAAERLSQHIRSFGHLAAGVNPLNAQSLPADIFNLDAFQLSDEDLRQLPAALIWQHDPGEMQTAYDVVEKLKQLYTGTLAFQFSHVHVEQERLWLVRMVETGASYPILSVDDRRNLLQRLIEVDEFEKFLHHTFVGQKRFSIEGLDVLVPIVDAAVRAGVFGGASNVAIGMAHRGRLNMLAHVLGKPYEQIFAEFQHAPNKEMIPSEGSMGINFGWTGDVKYHLGAERDLHESALHAHLSLANNPSHLEFVNPVVEGYTRAAQEDRDNAGVPELNENKALAILIHGDAAFPGEGIVAETLNLSRLPGYRTGGTLHIIANNQIGFTTESDDSRSTKYASDLAKGFEIPIVHVNADDPEACIAAVHLAIEYRQAFKKDFLIDLVGYRRYGHNEMDDPATTQPHMVQTIAEHPSVRRLYCEKLIQDGMITTESVGLIEKNVRQKLQNAFEIVKGNNKPADNSPHLETKSAADSESRIKSVSLEKLRELNNELLHRPDHFHVYPKLEKNLQKRSTAFEPEGKIEWALAESLAFASLLHEGVPIRFTGQDTERGTFAQRNLVLHDSTNGQIYTPLQNFAQSNASFAIFNSPLSEASALGFEYGYNIFARNTLVIWEAQFGDFANAAQVIIDQFVLSGFAKWKQMSSIVLLLPHGYEGQGPEHSSARLERFLQLAADGNCTIANLTSAAQYYHLLRRQAAMIGSDGCCPLIIMTPKSLLRNPQTASLATDFSEGRFEVLLPTVKSNSNVTIITRLILCSGKVAIDLYEEMETHQENNQIFSALQIVRVEQLYPFPAQEISNLVHSYPHLQEVCWVQEEPQNMGAWNYVEAKMLKILSKDMPLNYIGRPERSSPAAGFPDIYKQEQRSIVRSALYDLIHV